ncbi:hypothetical protein OJF2_47520 [Aquisphaera giovannonii]|uniref:HD domain-containing protein n=1 Tax=Aquisphaera giovannonii TaxID=406548 RepID=A0A5B9W6B0_9BACT|nr:hypothetical protein [Aquisphaera giovannonii]QEH36192.1 hypothetical protein OJF2_47520 [Aquisphaera giovannonii]
MEPDIPRILREVLKDYALPWDGDHGVAHWARVLENGERLAKATGADLAVVRLFAVLHDSRRVNEHGDPGHGARGAELARELRGLLFDLDDPRFRLLHRACAGHTDETTHPDVTIRTCWDADRLDLGRVGIEPDPQWLGTDAARDPEMLKWADGRATFGVIPQLVRDEWGIDLANLSRTRRGRAAGW